MNSKHTPVLYSTHISTAVKQEWQIKEYASWEDNKMPETGHIYPLLCGMPKNKIICKTQEEIALVYKSASYQTSWDTDDSLTVRLVYKVSKIIRELSKLKRP